MKAGERIRGFYTKTLVLAGGNSSQDTQALLSGRARQLLRVHGYRMGGRVFGTMDASGHQVAFSVILLAGPRAEDAGETQGIGSGDFDGFQPKTRVIDVLSTNTRIPYAPADKSGVAFIEADLQSEWVTTDLLLPGLSMFFTAFSQSSIEAQSFVIVEYAWETHDLADIAALQFAYGLDPVDFDGAANP